MFPLVQTLWLENLDLNEASNLSLALGTRRLFDLASESKENGSPGRTARPCDRCRDSLSDLVVSTRILRMLEYLTQVPDARHVSRHRISNGHFRP
jgi:hypothetical protein